MLVGLRLAGSGNLGERSFLIGFSLGRIPARMDSDGGCGSRPGCLILEDK